MWCAYWPLSKRHGEVMPSSCLVKRCCGIHLYICTYCTYYANWLTVLDKYTTLWGEPERIHLQNVEQLQAHNYLNPGIVNENWHWHCLVNALTSIPQTDSTKKPPRVSILCLPDISTSDHCTHSICKLLEQPVVPPTYINLGSHSSTFTSCASTYTWFPPLSGTQHCHLPSRHA